MRKLIRYVSVMTILMGTMWGNTLGINSSSIIDGDTQISSKPNLVFVFTNEIKSSSFVLKNAKNKNIALRKKQQNNTVSLIPRRTLKELQKYTLSMEAKDGSGVLIKTITFTVGKGDREAPVITSSSSINIDENRSDVMRISANDDNKIIYALMKSRDTSMFNLDSNSGVLSLKEKADYEKKKVYVTKVSATDIKGNSSSSNITVRIKDLDEVAPVIKSSTEVIVKENQISVMTIKVLDKSTVTYALSGMDASSFNISTSGVLSFKVDPDYETKKSYSITINVKDESNNSTSKNITVLIKDLDDTEPVFTSPSSISVNEGQKYVMSVKAIDQNRLRYTLSGSDVNSFKLHSKSGKLTFKTLPSYKIRNSYSIIVTAIDRYGNSAKQTINILIHKDDEEEKEEDTKAPVFISSPNVSVSENKTSVLIVKATDDNEVSYALNGIDKSSFNLNSRSGVLSFKIAPDYEIKKSYLIKIMASDSFGNQSTQNLTIRIIDINEEEENKIDTDGDGILDINDIDDDNDGVADNKDALPLDATENLDTDGDGIGNNKDTDDDNDGVLDVNDAFPLLASENKDSDGDGIGDNADTNKSDGIGNNSSYTENYSRAQYLELLREPEIMDSNKFPVASKYMSDFKNEGWPETAHVLLRHFQANAREGLFEGYDGVSGEGMNYHFFWLSGMLRIAAIFEGYTDPESWIPPTGIKKITTPLTHNEIMPPSKRWNSFIEAALMLTLPDGTDSGIADSGLKVRDVTNPKDVSSWGSGGNHYAYGLGEKSVSYLLPSFGQLGLGEGEDSSLQTQSLLHFSPKYHKNKNRNQNGHAHSDTLMMGLFGKGRNLLSFPGHQHYSHGPHNKNMVSIGIGWQNHWKSDLAGQLEIFTSFPGIQIGRVDASHIMHGGNANGTGGVYLDKYRRTLIQNTVDIEKSYLLDVFEVKGGKEHNYVLRGSGVLEQEYPNTNLSMSTSSLPYSKDRWKLFENTKKVDYSSNKSFWIDFLFSDNTKLGSRTHFPAQLEAGTLYLNSLIDEWDTTKRHPHLMLYRKSNSSLESTFVAVHEVLDGSGNSFISSVTQSKINNGSAIAVEVILKNGRKDIYLISLDGQQHMLYKNMSATATIAVSSSFETMSDLWMVNGELVTNDLRVLTKSLSEKTSVVSAVNREEDGSESNSFETPMLLPSGYVLAGQTILLENYENGKLKFVNGHTIEKIVSIANGSKIYLRYDPGVEINNSGVREIHYPWREADISKLKFIPSETTVPRITHIEPGEKQWQRITARKAIGVNTNDLVTVTTVPDNVKVIYDEELSSGNIIEDNTEFPVIVSEDMKVVFDIPNVQGLVSQKSIIESYYTLFESTDGKGLNQGLKMHKYSGGNVNFDEEDNAKYNNGVGLNYYDLGRWNTTTISGLTYEDIPGKGEDSNPNIVFSQGIGRGALISGYIDIPKTGLYNFYSRVDSDIQLKIDAKVIIEQAGMRRAAQWKNGVYLEKGLHEIKLNYFVRRLPGFSIMWDGPNIPYADIPKSILFQDIE